VATGRVICPGVVAGVSALDGVESGPMPRSLRAETTNVYATPFTMLLKVHSSAVVVHVWSPGEAVTTYAVIAAPPSELGCDHDTLTLRYADCSGATAVGAPGEVAGVIASELAGVPVPILLVAVTENVYATPLVSPDISQV
jgi:hypothetical protein